MGVLGSRGGPNDPRALIIIATMVDTSTATRPCSRRFQQALAFAKETLVDQLVTFHVNMVYGFGI